MAAFVLRLVCTLQALLLFSTMVNALKGRFVDPPKGSELRSATKNVSNSPFLPDTETSEDWVSESVQQRYAFPSPKVYERWKLGLNRSNVVWVHMHKAGGTWLCNAAKDQGESVSLFNCNWPGDGCWGGEGWHPPRPEEMVYHKAHCAERESSSIFSLSMMERPLMRGDLHCQNALLGTMVRWPLEWLTSVAAYERLEEETLAALLREIREAKTDSFRSTQVPGYEIPSSVLHHMFDNFMVRTLSGNYFAPIGSLTESDLGAAVETLRRMHVVIPLEKLGDHVIQLEKVFQWDRTRMDVSRKSNEGNAESDLSDYILDEFDSLNDLDRKLYVRALDLATERSSALLSD